MLVHEQEVAGRIPEQRLQGKAGHRQKVRSIESRGQVPHQVVRGASRRTGDVDRPGEGAVDHVQERTDLVGEAHPWPELIPSGERARNARAGEQQQRFQHTVGCGNDATAGDRHTSDTVRSQGRSLPLGGDIAEKSRAAGALLGEHLARPGPVEPRRRSTQEHPGRDPGRRKRGHERARRIDARRQDLALVLRRPRQPADGCPGEVHDTGRTVEDPGVHATRRRVPAHLSRPGVTTHQPNHVVASRTERVGQSRTDETGRTGENDALHGVRHSTEPTAVRPGSLRW